MGITRVLWRITAGLSLDQKNNRVDLILDRIARDWRAFKTCLDIIYVDETWLNFIREPPEVFIFAGEEK